MATAPARKPSAPKQLPPPNSDFYRFAETLGADELAILKRVRAFMETKVAPIINKYWADDAFPFELLPSFKELGIGGLGYKGYGCAGGSQKLFGWVGGYGIVGTGGFFESIGFRPGRLHAALAGASEFMGGLLVFFGLLGPIGPALMLSVMIVAAMSVHRGHGLFTMTNGVELPLLYGAAAVGLAFIGFGTYSLDAALGLTPLWTHTVQTAALAIGVVGAGSSLAMRRPVTSSVAA